MLGSNRRRGHPRRESGDTILRAIRQQAHDPQWPRCLAIACIMILCLDMVTLAGADPYSLSSTSPSFHRKTPLFKRRVQSWMIRQKALTKSAKRMDSRRLPGKAAIAASASRLTGSMLTFQRPTKERIFRWFGAEGEDPNQVLRCMMIRNEYNHNMVGITNPLLHIGHVSNHHEPSSSSSSSDPMEGRKDESDLLIHRICNQDGVSRQQGLSDKKALPVSRVQTAEKSWWPPLQTAPNEHGRRSTERKKRKQLRFRKEQDDWRILVYRKRVGMGRECYQRVRDAALDWEFQSDDGSLGMLEVPACCPSKGITNWGHQSSNINRGGVTQPSIPNLPSVAGRYSVLPVVEEEASQFDNSCGYRSLGSSSRRLVSFASKFMAGSNRRLFAINPVMVVYDLVDQRAPRTTFTSTAYATLKGHWLQGEERVTVALRDGSQDVDVEILSISRAGSSLWGKTVWPFIGNVQSKFFEHHLDHLARTGASAMNGKDDESLALFRVLPFDPSSATRAVKTLSRRFTSPSLIS